MHNDFIRRNSGSRRAIPAGPTIWEVKEYVAFMKKWASHASPTDFIALSGYITAQAVAYVLQQCGDDDLTRQNILKQATSLKGQRFKCICRVSRSTTRPRTTKPTASCAWQGSKARLGSCSMRAVDCETKKRRFDNRNTSAQPPCEFARYANCA